MAAQDNTHELSSGDPEMRRIQQRILEQLRKNTKKPVLAELAREIAAGKLTARGALSIESYAEAVFGAGRAAFSKIAALPDEERIALAQRGRDALDEGDEEGELTSELESTAHQHGRYLAEVEDEAMGSIMVRAADPRHYNA